MDAEMYRDYATLLQCLHMTNLSRPDVREAYLAESPGVDSCTELIGIYSLLRLYVDRMMMDYAGMMRKDSEPTWSQRLAMQGLVGTYSFLWKQINATFTGMGSSIEAAAADLEQRTAGLVRRFER